MNRVIIIRSKGAVLTFLLKDDKVWDILAYPETKDGGFKTGDIYKAKVVNIQKNINAAFLLLSNGVKAFMDIKESSLSDVKPESEITVQIVKEAFGEKEMVVTPHYSVAGKYLALTHGRHGVGVSRKLPDEKKTHLKELMYRLLGASGDIGAVIRTNAGSASEEEIEEEFETLREIISDIERRASFSVPFIKLYSAPSPECSYIRDLPEPPYEIVTDDEDIFEGLKEGLRSEEGIDGRIRLYRDEYPLSKLCRLEAAVDEIYKKTVYLKDGGSLIIEKTEACHVIDVNSGKNTRKIGKKQLVLETNLEAVREAARQIRIRNLSGMILIDLINMSDKDDKDKVINELREELKKDRIRAEFADLTALGIAEITREKRMLPLREVLK